MPACFATITVNHGAVAIGLTTQATVAIVARSSDSSRQINTTPLVAINNPDRGMTDIIDGDPVVSIIT